MGMGALISIVNLQSQGVSSDSFILCPIYLSSSKE